jgi:hypothetical protein
MGAIFAPGEARGLLAAGCPCGSGTEGRGRGNELTSIHRSHDGSSLGPGSMQIVPAGKVDQNLPHGIGRLKGSKMHRIEDVHLRLGGVAQISHSARYREKIVATSPNDKDRDL